MRITNVGTSFIAIFISCFLSVWGVSYGQSESDKPAKWHALDRSVPLVLARLKAPVKLDGLSNEEAWKDLKPLPLTVHVPEFRGSESERTEILLAHDDQFLYAAGRLYDSEPSKIQSSSKKRDELKLSNDWFGIILDTFNDNENALAFFTTPTGLRLDMTIFNDAKEGSQGQPPINSSWNTFWDVATVRNEEGWFVEMRIPFSSLRFQEKNGRVVMGLITWRWIARKNEMITFPDIPPDWGFWSPFKPSQTIEVVLEGISSRKPFYVAPYVLGGSGHTNELNADETAYQRLDDLKGEIGLDVKYGLTSNLTVDVTLNTDFAQVEADDQQINLTRFSLFFPEKRLFFQERASIFDVSLGGPNRLFYSRRIGIHEGSPVRILGGARIVGRVGPWDLGFLSMQTGAFENLPSENFSVFRLRRQVFNPYSYIGGMITSRIGMDGSYNLGYLLDGIFRLFGNDYLTLNWAQVFETGGEKNLLSLDPARIRLNWERRTLKGIGYDWDFSRTGKSFDPGIGFEPRDNNTRIDLRLWYGWFPGERSSVLRNQVLVNGSLFRSNERGLIESAEAGPSWEIEIKSGLLGRMEAKIAYEDVAEAFSLSDDLEIPAGRYTYFEWEGMLRTPRGKMVTTETSLQVGSFYDGWKVSLGFWPSWSLSSSLELSGAYQFNRAVFSSRDRVFQTHLIRLRVLAMLSTKFSATAFVQYNTAADIVIANVRFRYNPREGNDFYLVYNEGINTHRFREIPFLPFTKGRAIMLKYTYTFNF